MKLHDLGLLFALCLVFLVPGISQAEEVQGVVVQVVDGNTLELEVNKERIRILLADIDCPELDQEFGEQARKFLEKRLLKKKVKAELKGKDRRGNLLGVVFDNNEDVRVDLLKEGLAWTAEKNGDPELEPYKSWAKQKSRGLWQTENPTPPWVYRRQQSMLQPKGS